MIIGIILKNFAIAINKITLIGWFDNTDDSKAFIDLDKRLMIHPIIIGIIFLSIFPNYMTTIFKMINYYKL